MKTVDVHLDLAFDIEKQRSYGKRKVLENEYLSSCRIGDVGLIVSSIFVENQYVPEMALRIAMRQISALKADILECDDFCFCTTYEEVENAWKLNRIAIMLSFEDCIPIYNDISLLPLFYELGVRFMGLSWSRRNYACDGASFKPVEMGTAGGLTEFGVSLVRMCSHLGIIIDVSHLNKTGFDDVLKYTEEPIIASHSNVASIVATERNLSDDQIKKIIQRKGFIGMNAMNFLVGNDEQHETISALADHIDHIIKLGGEDCVGFGFDFNDQILKYIPKEELALTPRPCRDVMHGYGEIPSLLLELKQRGYSDLQIEKIKGDNFIKILKEKLGGDFYDCN